MSRRLNVGYVGWLLHDDSECARAHCVCDIVEEKVERYVGKHPDVRGFTDYREMAQDPELDVVVISTPNWLHCEMAEEFLRNGKHVFCEKPMGVNREEMDRMLVAQRRSGRQLALDFEMRSSAGLVRIKEIVDSGELGEVVGLEFVHHRGAWLAEGSGKWRVKPEKSGGLYFMEVCHEVDFMRWLMGEITHVQSFKTPNVLPQYESGMPDNVFTHLVFESGAIAHLGTSHTLSVHPCEMEEYNEKGHDMKFVVTGRKGSLRYDPLNNKLLVVKQRTYPKGSHGTRIAFDRIEEFENSHAAHHDITAHRRAFLEAVSEDRPFKQDAYDAWRTHAVCLAAERSAREDCQRIEVDYTDPGQ